MKEGVELFFFPALGMGHLLSAVEIAELLIHRDHHISITIFILKPPFDLKITSFIQSQTSQSRLKFVTLPVDDLNPNIPIPSMIPIDPFKPRVRECVQETIRTVRLGGFVIDMFSTAMIDVANEFGVPTYVFYTSGAAVLGFLLHMPSITVDEGMEDLRGYKRDLNIPTYVNPYPPNQFPSALLDKHGFAMFRSMSKLISATKGVLVNSFLELESHAIKALSHHPNSPPVYPVGPILNLAGAGAGKDSQQILEWLDDQPEGSVVFLCFGSEGYFPEEQVKEIAIALERSGKRFLWTLRCMPERGSLIPGEYSDPRQVLPNGFLERTQGVGKVIGWAPQVAILSHPGVGGFVSHCGWNSTLESIWFGKPMAAWPIAAEQQANAFQIVKEMGIGVDLKMDYKRDFKDATKFSEMVRAEEIERGIRSVMDPLNPIRLKAKEMSEKSRSAIVEGGSSYTNVGRFIQDVFSNIN